MASPGERRPLDFRFARRGPAAEIDAALGHVCCETMADRALLIGINTYPRKPLSGAVNDVLRVKRALETLFPSSDLAITLLLNGDATRWAILEGLKKLVDGVSAGDRLLFYFSGHGMQLDTWDPAAEADGKDEAICPVDIDLATGGNAIRDRELRPLLEKVPAGVSFAFVADSCSSRDLAKSVGATIDKSLAPPPGLRPGRVVRPLSRAAREVHVGMISACSSNGLALEADFDGHRGGALTQALLSVLHHGGKDLPLSEIVSRAAGLLVAWGYSQSPSLEGDEMIKSRPLWAL